MYMITGVVVLIKGNFGNTPCEQVLLDGEEQAELIGFLHEMKKRKNSKIKLINGATRYLTIKSHSNRENINAALERRFSSAERAERQ